MEMQDALIVVNGEKVTVADVIVQLKVQGVFRDEVCRLVETLVLERKAQELDIEVTEAEFYDFASKKRHYWGLTRAEDMNEFCRAHGITLEQWQESTRRELLRLRVRSKVVEESTIIDYFKRHCDWLKTVSLSRIVCADRSKAEAVMRAVVEEGKNFSDLARKHSLEENTRVAGGYLGTVRRGMLPPQVDEGVFAGKVGDILGPYPENGHCSLYKIEAIREPELGETNRKEIADRLFDEWLQNAINDSRFERPK